MVLEPDEIELKDDDDAWPPPAAPAPQPKQREVRILIERKGAEPYPLRSALRLLLGSAVEGGDQFLQRLKQWQTDTDSLGTKIYSESADETERERLRYAMLGLLSLGPDAAETAAAYALGASEMAYGLVSRLLSPLTRSRAVRPLARRYEDLATRGEAVVEHWIDLGRAAEQRSRALARHAANEGMDEAMDVAIAQLADDESVRELVTQQSMGMADEVVDAVRLSTARADSLWERRLRALFGRQ